VLDNEYRLTFALAKPVAHARVCLNLFSGGQKVNRIVSHFGQPALVLLLLVAVSGCGKTESEKTEAASDAKTDETSGEDLSTPEKTLAALKSAAASHDYSKMCAYFTPNAKKTLAAGMVMMGGFMQALDKSAQEDEPADPAEAAKNHKRAEAITALFEKHGLTEGNRAEVKINLNDSKEQQDEQLRKVADPIKDHCQFFAEMVKLMREHADDPDVQVIEDNAHMEGLKVEGDTAKAEFVQTRTPKGETKGSEKRSPMAFQKVDGKWLISEIPSFLN
jgi:hypothetical protein